MASIGTLWTIPPQRQGKVVNIDLAGAIVVIWCDNLTQILATAALGGITVDLPAEYRHYEDNKKPEFLSKFPLGKIPALETKDGFNLFEGSSIANYSAWWMTLWRISADWVWFIVAGLAPNSGLLGGDAKERALVDQWVHLADTEISPSQMIIHMLLSGSVPYNKPVSLTFITLFYFFT